MIQRVILVVLALFWVTMNVLLWRAEFGAGGLGGEVPPRLVIHKILTAPDDSFLTILQRGRRVGHCRWSPNVGDELASGKIANENEQLEGMVRRLSGYRVDLDGHLELGEAATRLSFFVNADFGTNRLWRTLKLRFVLRPTVLEFRASAAERTVEVHFEDDERRWQRTLGYDDLRQPATALSGIGGPLLGAALAGLPLPLDPGTLAAGLRWEARNGWLRVGRSQIRVYRLETRLFDRYRAVVVVSRVGEILRVELPDGLVLLNEALQPL